MNVSLISNSIIHKLTEFPKLKPIIRTAYDNVKDIFERQSIKLKVYNAFTNSFNKGEIKFNPKTAGKFEISGIAPNQGLPLVVDYDPLRVGNIIDKETGENIPVAILKTYSKDKERVNEVVYNFMSEDLQKEYGYVHLEFLDKNAIERVLRFVRYRCVPKSVKELYRDYPNIGLVGERVEVKYLENFDDQKYGGIGMLADKMETLFCKEKGIEPSIISVADLNSHVAHYKRGKRFIIPPKGSSEWTFFKEKYGKVNPNLVLREKLKDKPAAKLNISDWPNLIMYLPKKLAYEYCGK